MRVANHLLLLSILAILAPAVCAGQESTSRPGNAAPAQAAGAENVVDCKTFGAGDPNLELISELCVFALTYRGKLPDFIAQQTTTSSGPGSRVVVTAQVTYRQGEEQHSQLTINGKPVPTQWRVNADLHLVTNGEFGPLLINLFEVPGAIKFAFSKTDTLQGVQVAVFDFHLPKDKNTFWAILPPRGGPVKPEFRGRVWVDMQSGRIVREEVDPVTDSWQTGVISAKVSTDYSPTKVSDLGSYLLPVKSQSTVCVVGRFGANPGCTTNTIVFHDYQKFGATSRVLPSLPEQ